MSTSISSLPRVAVLGAFSSGKTSLINAMLGTDLPTDVGPTTAFPTLLRHAPVAEIYVIGRDGRREAAAVEDLPHLVDQSSDGFGALDIARIEYGLPNPLLLDFELLDLPGYGDCDGREGDWFGELDSCVASIVCSISTACWTAADTDWFERLPRALRVNAVIVVTEADNLNQADDIRKVIARVRKDAPRGAQILATRGLAHGHSGADDGVDRLTAAVQRAARIAPALAALTTAEAVLDRLPVDDNGGLPDAVTNAARSLRQQIQTFDSCGTDGEVDERLGKILQNLESLDVALAQYEAALASERKPGRDASVAARISAEKERFLLLLDEAGVP